MWINFECNRSLLKTDIFILFIKKVIILLKLTNHSDYADQLFRYP